MEIKHRMSKRFAWLLGLVGLVAIGLLVACGTTYNSSSDGLVLVGSQGSALIQTFSFSLANGHISAVSSPPSTSGTPSSIVLDPAGAYAYVIIGTSIQAFKVNSDGTLKAAGLTTDATPIALSMDSAGKFLFVAEGLNSIPNTTISTPCPATATQYGVCVYSIGSGGSLTPVPGAFAFTGQVGFQTPNLAALAPTPT